MKVAYWCVLAAALMPYLIVIVAKSGGAYDNHAPRAQLAAAQGWRQRLNWAHLNAFEAFAPFAAAVLTAEQLHAPQPTIDRLALVFVGLRLLHPVFYALDKPALRSLVWAGAYVCVLSLFLINVT
ncbi:MAG TPA: MAPEG family protein [Acidiferrobacteraceae bacterium]|nr:MAPEG family protein [Acidiferrobacteraceae bacterium]